MISYQYGTGLDAQGSTMDAAGKLPRSRCRTAYKSSIYEGAWQEWRDSNPQPPVLETGALAIELHSYGRPDDVPLDVGRRKPSPAKQIGESRG